MKIKKLLKDVLIGLIVTLVLFGLIEGALWALGLGGSEQISLAKGFDDTAAYLVPDPETDGGWMTQFYNGTNPEHKIPPKSDKQRVIMFGGSNTRSFQGGRLQRHFNQLSKKREFEEVNLGRSGYGSGRVAVILRQALDALDPDIVFLYTGHNEFVEAGFLMDLDKEWSSSTLKSVAEVLKSTRTVSLLTETFAENRVSPQTKPEAWKWEYSKFKDLTYEETLEYFAAYEARLRQMCRDSLDSGAKVVLSTIIYNRFAVPFVANFASDADPQKVARFKELHEAALGRIPKFMRQLLPVNDSGRVHHADWKKGKGDLPQEVWDRELPGRREAYGALAEQDPLYPDLKFAINKVWLLYDNLETFFRGELDDATRADLEQAEKELLEAIDLFPDHPRALFLLGLIEMLLDRPEERFYQHIEDSHRFDRAPRKASFAINDIIRRVAADIDGVTLLDADAMFAERVPNKLMGWEWMTDHCHLHIGARVVLMRDLAELIVEKFAKLQ